LSLFSPETLAKPMRVSCRLLMDGESVSNGWLFLPSYISIVCSAHW
jgi:hypothetical protein